MATVYFTGFPGQLGSELVPRVLSRPGAEQAVCLIQPKAIAKAVSAVWVADCSYDTMSLQERNCVPGGKYQAVLRG